MAWSLNFRWGSMGAPKHVEENMTPRHMDLLLAPRLLQQALGQIPGVVPISYEALVDDPESVMQAICESIGVDYDPSMLTYGSAETPVGVHGDPEQVHLHPSPITGRKNR